MKKVLLPDVVWFQEGPGVRNTQYTDSGVKLLNVANLVDGKIDLSNTNRFISNDEAYGRYKHFLVDDGDLIIASSGIKVEYFDKKMGFINQSHLPLCMNTSTIRFKTLDSTKLDIRYFMYFLKSDNFKLQLSKQITGSAQLNFGPSHLKKMSIPIIAIEKQRRIASVLDKVSGLIDKRRRQMDRLDELVKSEFIEMFGDPVRNPFGWEKRKLVDICTKLTDGTHFSPESFPDGEYKYITAKNIKEDGFDFTNLTYVTKDVHDAIYARCNPELGDVLYIKDGVTTGIAMTNSLNEPFTMLSSVALLKQNRKLILGEFLCSVLNDSEMYRNIRSNMGGAAITRLTIKKLKEIMIILPPLKLQQQFVFIKKQADKSKDEIKKSLEKLETLKKALMQKYFG